MTLNTRPDFCNHTASVATQNVRHRRLCRIFTLSEIPVRRIECREVQSQQNLAGRGFRVRHSCELELVDAVKTLNNPCFHADDCRMKGFSKLSFKGRIVG